MDKNVNKEKYSFDEFKMYYDSTEKVTQRRIENNRWNYSVCIAILLAIGYIWNWATKTQKPPESPYIAFTLSAILSGIAIIFSSLWIEQIKDFKNLNRAKFAVLNKMAEDLFFNSEQDFVVVSYNPFAKEWDKLQELKALQKQTRKDTSQESEEDRSEESEEDLSTHKNTSLFLLKKYAPGLKSTDKEYGLPTAFVFIFIFLFSASMLPIIFKFKDFLEAWKHFLNLN